MRLEAGLGDRRLATGAPASLANRSGLGKGESVGRPAGPAP